MSAYGIMSRRKFAGCCGDPCEGVAARTSAAVMTEVENPLIDVLMHRMFLPAQQRDPKVAEAGVAKMTLYNHFKSKDELLHDIIASTQGELERQCQQAVAGAGLERGPRPLGPVLGPDTARTRADHLRQLAPQLVREPGVAHDDVGFARHQQAPHYLRWKETVAPWMATPRQGVRHLSCFPDAAGWG